MLNIYHDGTLIPSSVATMVRRPSNLSDTVGGHIWGDEMIPVYANLLKGIDKVYYNVDTGKIYNVEATAKSGATIGWNKGSEYFYKWGFEFAHKETGVSATIGENSPIYGIGAGKDEYAQSLLCEAYDSVRTYWLGQIKILLDLGYDGVDIRTTSHSATLVDYAYYGYNQPIIDAYKVKYGRDLTSESVTETTTRRISEIRGEFFLKFLKEASAVVHEKGKLMITDFFATAYNSYDSDNPDSYKLNEGINQFYQWNQSKAIIQNWKEAIDLSDEIVFKDAFAQQYVSGEQLLGKKLIDYAHSKNKPVTIHCYTSSGGNNYCPPSFFNSADSSSIDSVLFYELIKSDKADSPYIKELAYIKQIAKNIYPYVITEDKITGIKSGTSVGVFIKNLNMIGTFVVLDENGVSLSEPRTVKSGMKLLMNSKYTYTLTVE
jgi:hypothetical protein